MFGSHTIPLFSKPVIPVNMIKLSHNYPETSLQSVSLVRIKEKRTEGILYRSFINFEKDCVHSRLKPHKRFVYED